MSWRTLSHESEVVLVGRVDLALVAELLDIVFGPLRRYTLLSGTLVDFLLGGTALAVVHLLQFADDRLDPLIQRKECTFPLRFSMYRRLER